MHVIKYASSRFLMVDELNFMTIFLLFFSFFLSTILMMAVEVLAIVLTAWALLDCQVWSLLMTTDNKL